MSQFGMYFTKMNLNLHEEDDEDNILTEYEQKFSEKGSRIYRMEAKFHKIYNEKTSTLTGACLLCESKMF